MLAREQSPGYIARTALGVDPDPKKMATAERDTTCVLCGRAIAEGEPVMPWGDNGSFMDWSALALPVDDVGEAVCEDCAALQCRAAMQKYNKAVACAEGLFPFKRLDEQAYWLLYPPEPPFIIVLSNTTNQQHIWWRSQVSYSRDVFCVQEFSRSRWIDRRRVEALCAPVIEAWQANAKTMPFVCDLEGKNPSTFMPAKYRRGGKPYEWPDPELASQLASMREDDLWALMRITLSSAYRESELAKPEPIRLNN